MEWLGIFIWRLISCKLILQIQKLTSLLFQIWIFIDFQLITTEILSFLYELIHIWLAACFKHKRTKLITLFIGITPLEILTSHVVTQFVVMMVQCVLVIVFTLSVFDITCEGPVYLVAAMLMLQGLCGMTFGQLQFLRVGICDLLCFFAGMLISCLCENERTATYLGLGSFLPIVMLCGESKFLSYTAAFVWKFNYLMRPKKYGIKKGKNI